MTISDFVTVFQLIYVFAASCLLIAQGFHLKRLRLQMQRLCPHSSWTRLDEWLCFGIGGVMLSPILIPLGCGCLLVLAVKYGIKLVRQKK